MARASLDRARGGARHHAGTPAQLGRLPRYARIHRVLAGAPQPPARPHRVHAPRQRLGHRATRPVNKFEAYAPPAASATPLSPTELIATLRAALDPWKPGTPFWIFAYG